MTDNQNQESNPGAKPAADTKWTYRGEERLPAHAQHCDWCKNPFPRSESDQLYEPWLLTAPDIRGMPGEMVVIGAWCDRRCFESDMRAQVVQSFGLGRGALGAQPTR